VEISRREFSAAALCAAGSRTRRALEWRVLDTGPCCALRESFTAFRRLGIAPRTAPQRVQQPLGYIVPAVSALPDGLARSLSTHVRDGGALIFESAAGFAGFAEQRGMLDEYFGLRIGPPIDLWTGGEPIPYIDFTWPLKTKIRDFSRVVPVCRGGEIIALAQALPVAARRGSMVFLGSPIGPALYAGDREARAWFNALVRALSEPDLRARSPISAQCRLAT